MNWRGWIFPRKQVEAEIQCEIANHIADRAADLAKTGMTPEQALRRARIEFGGAEKFTEQAREATGSHILESVKQDLRFGLRLLRKSPGFTVTAVLMLALGIGVNAALFSVVDWLLLRPLPVAQPGQLTYLISNDQFGGRDNGFSYPNFADIRDQTRAVFSGVAGFEPFERDGLTVAGATAPVWTNYVSGNYFFLLGIHPALGRLFQPGDGATPGQNAELVLSYSYWQAHFGGRRDVLGRQVAVNGRPVHIIGVAPRGFHGALAVLDSQAFLPFSMYSGGGFGGASDFFHERGSKGGVIMIIARRRAGVSLAQIQPALQVVGQRLARQYPKDDPWRSVAAIPLTSEPPGPASGASDPLRIAAAMFLALGGLVLLLACVNIASLLLARAAVRRREMAVRAALGAGRRRLLRQMLLESLVLALLGGAGGLLVAVAASHGLNRLPLGAAIPVVLSFGLSWRVFAYTAAVALAAGFTIGLTPAWQASRVPPSAVLHGGTRAALGARTRLRSTLVVAEIAGSLALLIVAGLFVRSLRSVQRVDLGFNPSSVLNLSLDPHETGYGETRALAFYDALLRRVRALPGASSACVAAAAPFGPVSYGERLAIPGFRSAPNHPPYAGYNSVTPGYFSTLGIRLLRGRAIAPSDGANTTRVAVVNQTMAQRYWPAGDALGRTFTMTSDAAHPVQVVGIVADSYTDSLSSPVGPYLYLPLAQSYKTPAVLQIRAPGASFASLAQAVRSQVA
ncbi:MAG: ADOP family duplicated permease, partial [Terriglobales bacterium]